MRVELIEDLSTDKAKELRNILKSKGYGTKQLSVTTNKKYETTQFVITIKDSAVNYDKLKDSIDSFEGNVLIKWSDKLKSDTEYLDYLNIQKGNIAKTNQKSYRQSSFANGLRFLKNSETNLLVVFIPNRVIDREGYYLLKDTDLVDFIDDKKHIKSEYKNKIRYISNTEIGTLIQMIDKENLFKIDNLSKFFKK